VAKNNQQPNRQIEPPQVQSQFEEPPVQPPVATAVAENPADDPLLKISEVAELFRVHHNTVRNWIAAKALPCINTPGGGLRVRRSHVAAIVGIATATA
jgi:excisionase family DNA binding protein